MITDTVYFTCLNNDCEKHRSIFVEGDPLHAHCEREELELAGQKKARKMPAWLMIAVPAVAAVTVAAVVLYSRRRAASSASGQPDRPAFREREGKTVPPPIS